MGEVMTFPKMIDEFIDFYSFKDSEEIYTNGSQLISVFRIKQALDHYYADVREVVHGKNVCDSVIGHCEFKCSVCGSDALSVCCGSLDGGKFNYCPHCGAKMEGGTE